tara:strand:- start:9021 stop:9380 length:360 start_codon:yes stop_codon:yes gene_type:complete
MLAARLFLFSGMAVILGFSNLSLATPKSEYMALIEKADQQLILQRYEDAVELYQKAMDHAEAPKEKVYVHYKLGMVYKNLNNRLKARQHFENGISVLEREKGDKSMRFHLQQALLETLE